MWCEFEPSPVEDETISNIFSSRGLFKLRSDEYVKQYPSVQACVQSKLMLIAIDKSLILVEEDMESECDHLSFNANIDALAISQSGNLIICGLSNGEVHGIFSKGVPLFNIPIQIEDIPKSGKTFIAIQEIDNRFHVICTNGSVYSLCEIDEIPLLKLNIMAAGNETVGVNESILEYVSIKRLSAVPKLSNAKAGVLLTTATSFKSEDPKNLRLITCAGRFVVSYSDTIDNIVARVHIPELYGNVIRIFNIENYVLLLTDTGHLLDFCPNTNLISLIPFSNEVLIDDLILIESNDESIELLALTKVNNTDEQTVDSQRLMKFLQFPSFKCLNEFEVPEHAWIVGQPKCAVNLYYLRGNGFNAEKLPTEIEMMAVSETHPSERFKKLIAKGHLKEAEDYGRHFDLCLQPIYEAEAKQMLVELCNLDENNHDILNKIFDSLLVLFEKIENRDFFHRHRMVNLQSRKILKLFLNDLLKRLDGEQYEVDILEIREQLRRLETLSIIDPYECDIDWHKFVYATNLVKYLTARLKNDIPNACFIWKRHSAAIIKFLDKKELQKFLTIIPVNTEAFLLIQWLRQFVPIIANIHPDIMPYITEWSIQKTRALQYSEHWPEIGLEFSTKVLEIMEELKFMHFDVRRQNERNISKIRDLVNALQDLSVLKNTYKLIFTLDNYQQESLHDTAYYILQRVHLNYLKSMVNDFLYPIFQEQGKTPVSALIRYINLMIASRNSLSTWLERAVECIELLHAEDDRMKCALAVLHCAPVPWPETVNALIKLRVSTHPLALKISGEYEMQAIKIMRAKYGWPMDSGGSMNLTLFMFCIVKKDLPDMFDDIRLLTHAAPEIAKSAHFNCCYQSVRRRKSETAYEFFKSLTFNDQNNVIELFAEKLENGILIKDAELLDAQKLMIEFFKLIIPKNHQSYKRRMQNIQSRFILFKYFGIKMDSVSVLVSLEKRLEFLENGIEHIIVESRASHAFELEKDLTKYFWNEIVELTNALHLHKIKGIRILCRQLKCLNLTCSLAYAVLDADDCSSSNNQDYVELALDLLAQQIIADKRNQSSSGLQLMALYNEGDPLTFQLAYELLVRAKMHEKAQPLQLSELLKYVYIVNINYPLNAVQNFYGNHLNEINETILKFLNASEKQTNDVNASEVSFNVSMQTEIKASKKRHSVSVFDEIEVQPQQTKKVASSTDITTIVKFVARTLLLLAINESTKNKHLKNLRNLLLSEDESLNWNDAKKSFFSSLEQLVKVKEHNVWYPMARYLLEFQAENDCSIIPEDVVTLQLIRVFKSLMTQKDCNFIDIFAMLIADTYTDDLLDKLKRDIRNDQQKHNFLTLLQMYHEFLGDENEVESVRFSRLKHFYYMEFCKQDPSIKGKFNVEIDNIDKLLKEFQNKQLDVHLLERISRDFNLDLEHMLVSQVISILQSQEIKYEIKNDSFGEEELVMHTTIEEIRLLCQPYIDKIKNTEILTLKLKKFISDINVYFYELYLYVIDILSFIDVVPPEMQIWKSILQFLKHKLTRRRRSRPGQAETDLWLQSRSDTGVLPKVARYRLPFKPIVERPLKDTLDNEIVVDNCESWFPLIELHTMLKGSKDLDKMRDYFCMSSVKNSIDEYKTKNDREVWHIQPTNNAFLKSILRLVKHMKKPSKVFLILYYVANNAPEGADQVEATYECYKYALEYSDHLTDETNQEQFEKIKRKYPILKTQHLLYEHGLTDEKLLHLVESPQELIFNLYHHELILKPSKLDINAVIKEIAELHDINLGVIQFQLLQKWLEYSHDSADGTVMEETFLEDQNYANNLSENFTENAGENVLRANYILNSWPKDQAIDFLIAHIYPSDGTSNTSKQLQMYECLSKFYDGSESVKSMLNQRQYITIKCVHDLKQLGYNSSVEKFEKCNKIDILKTIWQRNAQNPRTLEVLANICLGYDIYLGRIWNGILKRMVLSHMERELNALVDALSCRAELLHVEGLLQAWDYVLKHPFKNANQTRSFEQEEILQKTLFRIQSCPVLEQLNLLEFATLCIGLDRLHMAAVLMTLSKCENQRKEIKQLILPRKSEKLRKEILELEEAGILRTILNYTLQDLEL